MSANNKTNNQPKSNKKPKQLKFQVRDHVKVRDKHYLLSKSFTTNWNRGRFEVHEINSTSTVTYTSED